MRDCIFCRIARHEADARVVYEDDRIIAFHDIAPKAPTHLLVVPKQHIRNLADLHLEDEGLIAHLMLSLSDIAHTAGLDNGFRTITNTGPGGHQEVYHLHFHILGGRRLPAL
ncbi:histidine triad nucleotide-binding protein [Marinobacterium nitratireducens]|uniref:Histidine triad nucleotide-binding protein n=1 Tax=Marinobacterium nitratireducens TaxID=518897 RepID=A0A917ZA70_9GAMM|nr:histidine triad nucleotide-binding protein [Marinobacterium nitratireducens]GGO77185.1 histidine triad nucleotide-binding protein [Marinobacterium nitratireducens]